MLMEEFVIKFPELWCANIVSSVRVFKLDEINYINLGMSDPVIVYSMWFQPFKLDIILCVDTYKSFLKIKWYLNLNYFTFSMLFFLSPLDLKEVVLTDGSGYSSLASLETPARNYPISRYLISSCYFFRWLDRSYEYRNFLDLTRDSNETSAMHKRWSTLYRLSMVLAFTFDLLAVFLTSDQTLLISLQRRIGISFV